MLILGKQRKRSHLVDRSVEALHYEIQLETETGLIVVRYKTSTEEPKFIDLSNFHPANPAK